MTHLIKWCYTFMPRLGCMFPAGLNGFILFLSNGMTLLWEGLEEIYWIYIERNYLKPLQEKSQWKSSKMKLECCGKSKQELTCYLHIWAPSWWYEHVESRVVATVSFSGSISGFHLLFLQKSLGWGRVFVYTSVLFFPLCVCRN